jgi:hypothetical protein
LGDWFPQHPDGSVLWAEQLRQMTLTARDTQETMLERVEHLGRLAERGLPWLSDGLASAMDQLNDLADTNPLIGPLATLRERLRIAMRFHRPGGLFAVFAGRPDVVGPHLLVPIPR